MCQIQAAAITATDRRFEAGRLERAKSRHEILGHSRIIAEKLEAVSKEIVKQKTLIPEYDSVKKKFEDAVRSARVLNHSFSRGTFKDRVVGRSKYAVWFKLSAALQDCLKATARTESENTSVLKGEVRDLGWEVEFYEDDFRILFSNIYSNALKYAVAGSVIRTQVLEKGGQLVISIHNDVEITRDDDLIEIWKYERRGKFALSSKIPGQGIGLGLVSDICDVYEVDAWAEYTLDPAKSLTKGFKVAFSFSRDGYRGRQSVDSELSVV